MHPQSTGSSAGDALLPLAVLGIYAIYQLYSFPVRRVGHDTATNTMTGESPDDPSGLDDEFLDDESLDDEFYLRRHEFCLKSLARAFSLFVMTLFVNLLLVLSPHIGAVWAFLLAFLTCFLVSAALDATFVRLSTGTSPEQVSASIEEDVKQLRSEEFSKAKGEEADMLLLRAPALLILFTMVLPLVNYLCPDLLHQIGIWWATLDGSSVLYWLGTLCEYALNILNYIIRSALTTLTGILALAAVVVVGVTILHLSTSPKQTSSLPGEDVKQQVPLEGLNKAIGEEAEQAQPEEYNIPAVPGSKELSIREPTETPTEEM